MLPRPLSELYENVRDFFVIEEESEIVGCVGLHIVWGDLAEIKSIVIEDKKRKRGWGRALVNSCLGEARSMRIKRVFALTKIPEFFIKLGFDVLDKTELPHKVWAECIKCHKFPKCDEIAVGITVCEKNDIHVPSHEFEPMSPILFPHNNRQSTSEA